MGMGAGQSARYPTAGGLARFGLPLSQPLVIYRALSEHSFDGQNIRCDRFLTPTNDVHEVVVFGLRLTD